MEILPIKNFLEEILKTAGFSGWEINIQENQEAHLIKFLLKNEIKDDSSRLLIGREGENLFALEYVINIFARKHYPNDLRRIILDINNYRVIQEEKLRDLAQKLARKVAFTKEPIELPPMKASERRIIHLEIALRSDVVTESIGEGRERRVMIKPQEV